MPTVCDECDTPLIVVEGRQTCPDCGKMSTSHMYICAFDRKNEPLMICCYQRYKRYCTILSQILYPCYSERDTLMYKYLISQTFTTIDEVFIAMKQAKHIKDKRYTSLHLFCRLCLGDKYTKPEPVSLVRFKHMGWFFKRVESLFIRNHPNEPFFNYCYLVQMILRRYNIRGYDKYIKQIKCPKRRARYQRVFNSLCKDQQFPESSEMSP